jgi:hypothetical protein
MSDNWKRRDNGMVCSTCISYVRKEPKGDTQVREVGRCRKHAPTMNGFPVVFPSDWCGDHRLDEDKVAPTSTASAHSVCKNQNGCHEKCEPSIDSFDAIRDAVLEEAALAIEPTPCASHPSGSSMVCAYCNWVTSRMGAVDLIRELIGSDH